MLPKDVSLDTLWRNHQVAEAWANDKLERESAHGIVKALMSQFGMISERSLLASQLPEDLLLVIFSKPVSFRVVQFGGLQVCFSENSWEDVIPERLRSLESFKDEITIFNVVMDRGPSNVSAFNFLLHEGFALAVGFGLCHDLWNSIKTGAKMPLPAERSVAGESPPKAVTLWSSIVKFSSICNLNHGPFRSGVWGKGKQQFLVRLEGTKTSADVEFRAAAVLQAELNNEREPVSEDDFEQWWGRVCRLRSAHESGPVLKFARWDAVADCWAFHKDEIYLNKVVLQEMAQKPDTMLEELASNQTSMHDAEMATNMTTGDGGLENCAHGYITPELCEHVEMFVCVMAPLSRYHSFRIAEVKTHTQALAENQRLAGDHVWLNILGDVVDDSMYCSHHLRRMGCSAVVPEDMRAHNVRCVAQFSLHVISEVALRLYEPNECLPFSAIRLLHNNVAEVAKPFKADVLRFWSALLRLERFALKGCQPASRVLATLPQRRYQLIRLLCAFLELEEQPARPDDDFLGPISLHIVTSIVTRWADEKAVEDINGFVRDLGRVRRNKTVPMTAVHDRVIRRGVLSSRGIEGPRVEVAEIASVQGIKKIATERNDKMHATTVSDAQWQARLDRCLLPP